MDHHPFFDRHGGEATTEALLEIHRVWARGGAQEPGTARFDDDRGLVVECRRSMGERDPRAKK